MFLNFERLVLDAAQREAETPSFENLPPAGELVERTRVDPATGEKRVEFYGRRSFIADVSAQPENCAPDEPEHGRGSAWRAVFERPARRTALTAMAPQGSGAKDHADVRFIPPDDGPRRDRGHIGPHTPFRRDAFASTTPT